ncbi:DUF1488 domain-containing protein [Paraburkholderia azotifigens]|uniref:DUF1488 domain-containing protein n=1 Tax=Paraburkholderia azotifigens TaxID=2057004 RepID=UPI00317587C9
MRITFPASAPEYRGWNLTVGFPARVDGQDVDCAISAEALEDHFGAPSPGATDLLDAFNAHRPEIEQAARRLLHTVHTTDLLLHSGHFRFPLDGPARHTSSRGEA